MTIKTDWEKTAEGTVKEIRECCMASANTNVPNKLIKS